MRRWLPVLVVVLSWVALAGTAAATPPPPYAYVSSGVDSNVSVFNTRTQTQVASISVNGYAGQPAFSPSGLLAFVPVTPHGVQGHGTVAIVNTVSNRVVASVPVADNPVGAAVSPNGRYAYVANRVDPRSPEPTHSGIDLNVNASISVIDVAKRKAVGKITVGYGANDIAFSPNGKRAYVTSTESQIDSFAVIDTAKRKVIDVKAGLGFINPTSVAVAPDGRSVWVTNRQGVTVLNAASNTVAATIPGGDAPIAFSPDGRLAYVPATVIVASGSSAAAAAVNVVNTATRTVVASVPIGDWQAVIGGVALTADGSLAYVTNSGNDSVTVIDTRTNTVAATLPPAGPDPEYVTVSPALPPCGSTRWEKLKCHLEQLKTQAACTAEISAKTLKAIRRTSNLGSIRDVPKDILDAVVLHALSNKLRFRDGRTGADLWKALEKARTPAEMLAAVNDAFKSGIDVDDPDSRLFIKHLAAFEEMKHCADLVLP